MRILFPLMSLLWAFTIKIKVTRYGKHIHVLDPSVYIRLR